MSTANNIATLRSIADAWPEGSPQRAALEAGIADMERLEWFVASECSMQWNLVTGCYYVLPFEAKTPIGEGKTWREAIDAARGAK